MLKYLLLPAAFFCIINSLISQNVYPLYDPGFNMFPGRVIVYANDKKIYENIDWLGNYTDNKVKLINLSLIEHNVDIQIRENNEPGIFDPVDTLKYIDITGSHFNWKLSGVPLGQASKFPEAYALDNPVVCGYNRAKLSWHTIDTIFYYWRYSEVNAPPINYEKELVKSEVRPVREKEIFPVLDFGQGKIELYTTFDLDYYPSERGAYNFDVEETDYSFGINEDGTLRDPESRWASIIQDLDRLNMEGLEIKYLDILLLDPYLMSIPPGDDNEQAELLIQLGHFSEDINRDGHQFFENNVSAEFTGIPTAYGVVPFYETPTAHQLPAEDVGLDGLPDDEEKDYFGEYLSRIAELYDTSSPAYQKALKDPSADNYMHFRSMVYEDETDFNSILGRYKNFNQTEGNNTQDPDANYNTRYSMLADVEERNDKFPPDFDTTEAYYEYRLSLAKDSLTKDQKYIKDIILREYMSYNHNDETSRWINLSIPLDEPDTVVGDIESLAEVEQIRLVLRGCNDHYTLRFMWILASRIYDPVPRLKDPNMEPELVIEKMQIFPNPNNGKCRLAVKNHFARKIEIIDLMGNVVFSKDYGSAIKRTAWDITHRYVNLPALKQGVYIVRAYHFWNEEFSSRKMVVVKE